MPWIQNQIYEGFTQKMSQEDMNRSADLTVNVWPTTTDSIDWSHDAEIVIGAGDDVQLLIPKLKIADDTSNEIWELIRLRVNAFSDEELQQQDPISTEAASLGEEISTAEAVSVKWTPPGIAMHGRCALLVQTQNLLLSIWAPGVQPRSPQDWKRRKVVNRELQKYYEMLYPKEKQKPGEPRSESLKKLSRVRAFGVSKAPKVTTGSTTNQVLDSICYIATANDNCDVTILRCCGTSNEEGELDLAAITHFSITEEATRSSTMSWTFEDYMNQIPFVQHLTWSPWVTEQDGRLKSLLVCGTRDKLLFKWVCLETTSEDLRLEVENFEGSVKLKKPWTSDVILDWVSELHENRYGRLLACTSDNVMLFTIDLVENDMIQHVKYERKEWGQVAGSVILQESESAQTVIEMLPHLTTSADFLTSLRLDKLSPTDNHTEGVLDAIKHNRNLFDSKFSTHGHVLTRIWGLARSPLHDLVVTNVTFHPSNSPEYIIPADMSSRVVFQGTNRDDLITQAIRLGASTEAIAFSARWRVKDLKTEREKNDAVWTLLDQLDEAMLKVTIPEPDPASVSFKHLLYHSSKLTRLRYERVLSIMVGLSAATAEMERQTLEQIANRLLIIPPSRYKKTKTTALMLFNARKLLFILKLSADDEHGSEVEQCDICDADISLEGYEFAQCGKGHKFRRCALTFLAIQAPGISKSCGICGKQYLRPSRVEHQNGTLANDNDVEMADADATMDTPLLPLTELLSAACNRCIYCGGKFIK